MVNARAHVWPTILVVAASLLGSATALGSSAHGQFDGTVQLCQRVTDRCSPVAAEVTVYRVYGPGKRGVVTTQSSTHGQFSFKLAPARYIAFPSSTQFEHDRCISSVVRVTAGKNVSALVDCHLRVRRDP